MSSHFRDIIFLKQPTFAIMTVQCPCVNILIFQRKKSQISLEYEYDNINLMKLEYIFLKRGTPADDLYFGQPITQTALPFCIAIDILWNLKK